MGLDYKFLTRSGALRHEADAGATLNPSQSVLELVPESVARENLVLPLSLDGETLTCAAANPNDILLQDKLSFILTKKVRLISASPEAIRAAINRHYGQTETESMDSMLCEFTDTAFSSKNREGSARWARRPEGRKLANAVTESRRGVRGLESDFLKDE